MENVKVFRMNEFDGVAALSMEDAQAFYLDATRMPTEDAFDEEYLNEMPLTTVIYTDETMRVTETLRDVINAYWKGEPFIAFSQD